MDSEGVSINRTLGLLEETHDHEDTSEIRTPVLNQSRVETGQIIAATSIRRPVAAARSGGSQSNSRNRPRRSVSKLTVHLLSKNRCFEGRNLKLYLTTVAQTSLALSFCMYAYSGNLGWVYLPILVDVTLQLLCLPFYSWYGFLFETEVILSGESPTSISRETLSLMNKMIMGFTAWQAQEQSSVWWAIPAILFSILLLISENAIRYEKLYDSIFSFSNTITLALLLVKLYAWSSLSIGWVCIVNTVWGYICLIPLAVSPILLVIMMCSGVPNRCLIAAEMLIRFSNLFALGAFMLAVPAHFNNSVSWLHLDLFYASGIYGLTYLMQTVFFIFMRQRPSLFEHDLATPEPAYGTGSASSVRVTIKPSNRVFHIVKQSSNFFVHQSVGSTQVAANSSEGLMEGNQPAEEEEGCAICYGENPDCLILPCNHSGICKDCAKHLLKKNPKCYMCRAEIQQIFSIEPYGKSYRAKEEIVRG